MEPGAGTHWLPDSLEFTGSGAERVVVVLSGRAGDGGGQPPPPRARPSRPAGRDVAKMPPLGVDGDQTHWMLLKP